MSILNAILKKYPIIDFKMELLVRFLTTLNCKLYYHFTCSKFASDYNRLNFFYVPQTLLTVRTTERRQ